jgi:DNA-binding response OmpR family regulator
MRILNIDDSTINNMLMENLLSSHGYEALSVIKGNDVEEYIEDYQPDVIILDLMIPDRNGLDILKDLRRKNVNIPVVVITAMGSKEIRKEVENLGITAYHTKPIESEKLIESIRRAEASR